MSEPAVHEMQLSGKQLIFLFMTALVILGGAFFLGVSVGQGVRSAKVAEGDAAEPGTLASGASTTATPSPSPDLTFHEILQGRAGSGTPAAGAAAAGSAGAARGTEPPASGGDARPTPTKLPAKPTPTPTPAPTKPVPPATNSWFVQVDAFKSRENADKQANGLKTKGFPAFVVTSTAGLFTVRVGPYPTRPDANVAAKKLETEGLKPSVTR